MAPFTAPDVEPVDPLDRLVTVLDAAARTGGWHQPHRLVFVAGETVGFRTLADGAHPLQELAGFVAPPEWEALGVVCTGWAAPAAGGLAGVGRPSQHPERQRVRVVALVGRDGDERSTASLEDGTVIDESGEGIVLDALRRALGRPTVPPPCTTGDLLDDLWLQALCGFTPPLPWKEAVALRPTGPQPSWRELRDAGWPGLPADLAQWMDDGMFARWIAGAMPPRAALLDELERRHGRTVAGRVRRALGG